MVTSAPKDCPIIVGSLEPSSSIRSIALDTSPPGTTRRRACRTRLCVDQPRRRPHRHRCAIAYMMQVPPDTHARLCVRALRPAARRPRCALIQHPLRLDRWQPATPNLPPSRALRGLRQPLGRAEPGAANEPPGPAGGDPWDLRYTAGGDEGARVCAWGSGDGIRRSRVRLGTGRRCQHRLLWMGPRP